MSLWAVKLIGNAIKGKFINDGYRIAFDGAWTWNSGNDFVQNVMILGVDNSSSFHLAADL